MLGINYLPLIAKPPSIFISIIGATMEYQGQRILRAYPLIAHTKAQRHGDED